VRVLTFGVLATAGVGTAVAVAASTSRPAFAAKASVSTHVQYLHDTPGTVFGFTVHNVGTSRPIAAVEIDRPSTSWTITGCPSGPAGWVRQVVRGPACVYHSAATSSDDIQPGKSTSLFKVRAITSGGTADRYDNWRVLVYDPRGAFVAAGSERSGLGIVSRTWQITDAVVAAKAKAAGGRCPSAHKSSTAASTGNVIVICGRNRADIALTPSASHSSLAGSLIAGHGSFVTARIPARSGKVVLGSWTSVSTTGHAGSGKTVVTRVESAANRTSPLARLTGYTAVNAKPVARSDSYGALEDTLKTVPAPGVLGNDTHRAGHTLHAVMTDSPSHGLLTLHRNGSFTYTPDANYNGPDHFAYRAVDGVIASHSATVSLSVTPMNDAPSFALPGSPDQTVDEDAGAQSVSGLASGMSAGPGDESGQVLAFHTTNDNNSLFSWQPSIDEVTGDLTFTPAADANGSATVSVALSDDGGTAHGGDDTSATKTFTITVTAVNDAPVNTVPGAQSTLEDTALVFSTGNGDLLSVGDVDAGSGSVSMDLAVSHGTLLVASTTGLSPSSQPAAADLSFSGTLAAVNNALEGLIYVPDADYHGSDTLTQQVDDAGNTGSGGSQTDSDTVAITVAAVNDAPSFGLPGSPDQSVLEDAGAQTVSGFASGMSAGPSDESGQVLTFDVSNDNNGLFSSQPDVDESTGDLTFTPAADANGSATVSVALSDDGGTANGGDDTSGTQTFTVTVTAVNDAPSFTLAASPDQTVLEDAGAQSVSGLASGMSAGPGDESAQTLTFHASNDNNSLFSSQPAVDPATGDLTFTPAPDANGVATVSVHLTDNGGTANGGIDSSATKTFTITVTGVNDAPSFTLAASPDQTVLEDAGAQSVSGLASGMSAGPGDESAQTLTFHASNDNNSLFSSHPAVDPATGDLTFTPAPDATGVATVSVHLTDNGGTANGGIDSSATKTFTITVTGVNDAPSFTLPASPNQSVVEDAAAQTVSAFATNIASGPANESGQTSAFTLGNDNHSLFSAQPSIDATTGDLTYTPAAGHTGSALVTVTLSDNGGTANGGSDTSAPQTFTITVHLPNAAPTDITLAPATVDENQPSGTTVGTLTSTDADAGDTHTYALVSGTGADDNASFTLTGTGNDTVQTAATFNFETKSSYAIRVRTTDSGPGNLTFEKALTITINDVNEAPTDLSLSPSSIAENSGADAVVGALTPTDPDTGETYSYSLVAGTGSTDNGSFNVSGSNLRENASFDFEAKSSYSVRIQVTDGANTFAKAFTVTVTDVNEAPTDLSLSPSSIAENSGADAVVGALTPTDPDTGETYSYALVAGTGSTDNGSFNVSGSNLRENASFDFESKSSYSVRIQVTDGSNTFAKAFTVTVNDVNEAPTDIQLSKSDIDENGAANAVIGALTSTDEDAGQTHTYSLVSGTGSADNGSFNINSSNLRENTGFNYEVKNSYSIRIRTTDNGTPNLSFEKQFTITVNDVNDAPVANADSYTGAIGNTLAAVQTTPSGPKVVLTGNVTKANDTDEDATFPHTLSVTGETVSSTGGGTATIGTNGSFTFLPGPGDKNQDDTFTYHVTDGSLTTAGTVTVHIDNFLVWYVDNSSAASTHDGRSSQPFTGLSSLNGAGGSGDSDGPGDYVFLYRGNSGTTPYAGGIPLEANQSLWGEKQGLTVNGVALVAAGVNPAVITNAGGIGVGLANGVDIEGLNISGTSGDGVNGSAVTTATVGTSTAVNVSTAGGDGVDLSGAATGNISIAAPITGSTGHSVTVSGRSGGTVAFSGLITEGGTGVLLNSNTGATINFTAGITASTGANAAFTATGGGTVNVTDPNANGTAPDNTIATTTGIALNIASTTIGANGVTFRSISASGATNGVILNNTGAGSLTVTGDGSQTAGLFDRDGSGGTIQNSSQDAVLLTNANATIKQLNITNAGWDGVQATGSGNVTLSAVDINHPGNASPAANGSTGNPSGFGGGNGFYVENGTGTYGFDNNSRVINWQSSQSNAILLHNTNADFTSFTVNHALISTSATGGVGFHANLNGTTDGQVSLTNSEFTLIDQNAAQVLNNGSGTIRAIVQGNNFHDADATGGDGNNTLYLTNSANGHLNFTVGGAGALGNTFHNLARLTTLAGVVQVDAAGGSAGTPAGGLINGTITNNNIWNDAGFTNGRRAIDVQVEADSHNLGQLAVAITNNTVNNVAGNGIHVSVVSVGGGSVNDGNWTITGNNLGTPGTNNGLRVGLDNTDSASAIEFETNADSFTSGADTVNKLQITNNTAVNSANNATGAAVDVTNLWGSAASGTTSLLQATITNNTLTNIDTSGTGHVLDVLNSSAGDGETTNLNIAGNNTTLGASAAGEIRLRQLNGAFNIQGGIAAVSANNNGDTVNSTGSFGTVGSVTLPTAPSF
jgi:hypothetical protein